MGAVNIFGQKHNRHGLSRKSVIKGDFSQYKINYKELRIYKFNKFLAICLFSLVILEISTYMAVVTRETVVQDIHSKTNKIYYENIELQNNVDNLKSFYAIDNKVSKINFLKKPDRVIEVKATENPTPKPLTKSVKEDVKPLPAGF